MALEVVNAQGRTIYVLESDQRAAKLADAKGNLNPGSMSLWNALVELGAPWDLVLDVGANYGEMLAGSTRVPGVHVVAFEPNPAIASLLRQTVADLPFAVDVVESAVFSSDDAEVSFLSDRKWSGTSHLSAVERGVVDDRYEVVVVPTTTLDSSFPEPVDSAFIKVDVEGAEPHVLAGAERFLSSTRRVAIMMEILHTPVQDVWDLRYDYQMALWSDDVGGIVLVDAQSAGELGRLLHSGEYYRQDAVFFAGSDAAGLVSTVRKRWGTTSRRADRQRRDSDLAAAARAAERDELASTLDQVRRQESDLRAQNQQLSLELDVRAAEVELLRAEISDLAPRVADMQGTIDAFKRSRAYRLGSAYRKMLRPFRRR